MEMLVGQDWRDFFDVVIVNANKPKFFAEVSRPIRVFDKNANTHIWEKVTSLDKGIIYYEVCETIYVLYNVAPHDAV